MTSKIEQVVDAECTLGEGAIWDGAQQRLVFVDIEKHLVLLYDPVAGSLRSISAGQRVSTVVPRQDGQLLVALEKSVAVLNPDTETFENVLEIEIDKPYNRFNDGKCDPAGRFWIGTMAMDMQPGKAGLYRIDKDYSVKRVLWNVTISNGIAWSPDHTRMYYIDTPTRKVDCFDYDPISGDIDNRKTVIEVPASLGFPDGMTIDNQGNLWIAMFEGAAVTCWNPDDGRLVSTFPLPAKNATSCAFGGARLDELYVTTATFQMAPEEMHRYPQSGRVFRIRPGNMGVPCFVFG